MHSQYMVSENPASKVTPSRFASKFLQLGVSAKYKNIRRIHCYPNAREILFSLSSSSSSSIRDFQPLGLFPFRFFIILVTTFSVLPILVPGFKARCACRRRVVARSSRRRNRVARRWGRGMRRRRMDARARGEFLCFPPCASTPYFVPRTPTLACDSYKGQRKQDD